MSQEQGGSAALPARAIGSVRPRRSAWQHVGSFFRQKPLGFAGAAVAIILVIGAIFAPLIATDNPRTVNADLLYAAPGEQGTLLGGDQLGRDVFSRLVYGARISLYVGITSSFIGVTIGLLVGVASAHFGGTTDLVVQRLIDSMMAFPSLILAIALMAALGSSLNNVVIALSIIYIPSTARIVRSQALAINEMDYVLAAIAVGAGHWRIMLRHMVPNCIALYIVLVTIHLGGAIIAEASLSFLGIGAPPDIPAWGGMLRDAAQIVSVAPWLGVFPGLAIAMVVFAWNLLGDALRDVLDPRLRGTG